MKSKIIDSPRISYQVAKHYLLGKNTSGRSTSIRHDGRSPRRRHPIVETADPPSSEAVSGPTSFVDSPWSST